MRTSIVKLTAGLIIALFIAACSKNANEDLKERERMLTTRKWELSALKIKTDSGTVIEDAFAPLPAYRKDDYLLFFPDSTYEYNDNMILRADTSSKILDAGRWHLIDGGHAISMHSEIYSTTYNPARILELNSSKLFLETRYPDGSVVWTTFIGQ
jgi:hypothetical protein